MKIASIRLNISLIRLDLILPPINDLLLFSFSPTKSNKRGHQRRHSLTVCETPNMTNKLHKPPLFETQTSQISNVSAVTSSG